MLDLLFVSFLVVLHHAGNTRAEIVVWPFIIITRWTANPTSIRQLSHAFFVQGEWHLTLLVNWVEITWLVLLYTVGESDLALPASSHLRIQFWLLLFHICFRSCLARRKDVHSTAHHIIFTRELYVYALEYFAALFFEFLHVLLHILNFHVLSILITWARRTQPATSLRQLFSQFVTAKARLVRFPPVHHFAVLSLWSPSSTLFFICQGDASRADLVE